ncbi:MAG: nitrilase-related carbon-nitrogen hydrolase [Phocaeicola sp.]
MKHILFILLFIAAAISGKAQFADGLPKVQFIDYHPEERVWFARFGQFQLHFEYTTHPETGLILIKDVDAQLQKLEKSLAIAKQKRLNVLVFPELSISMDDKARSKALAMFQDYARENEAIIVAGTYYDESRYCKSLTILPNSTHHSYKTRPSIYEASPIYGEGVVPNDTLHVFRTKYGNLLTLVCVDLISDDANYMARNLSNRGMIDMLVNINFNPKSQEFMREAAALALRHPLFVSLTNVSLFQSGSTYDGDEYGNTSIFGSIDRRTFGTKIAKMIPDFYKTADGTMLQPAYKNMLALIPPEIEGVLIYDLNLRMIRTPMESNAPDQGYPSIKNIEVLEWNKL